MDQLLDVLARHEQATGDGLRDDVELRLVVERALQQLVDLAVKINAHVATAAGQHAPRDYFSTFEAAARAGVISTSLAEALAPSTGMRNRLVHEYDEIDLDAVAAAIPTALEGYRGYVREVASWLRDR